MTQDPKLDILALGLSLANRYASNYYIAHGLQQAKAVALAVLDKLKSLPSSIAELFADLFAKGINSFLVQQNKKLASKKEFLLTLPEPLIKETLLIYKKRKKRAMLRLEIKEEREQDAS